MDRKTNWSKHVEHHFDRHSKKNLNWWKQKKKFNYENVDLKSCKKSTFSKVSNKSEFKVIEASTENIAKSSKIGISCRIKSKSTKEKFVLANFYCKTKCHSPVNFVNKFNKNLNQMIRTNKMHSPPNLPILLVRLASMPLWNQIILKFFILIYLIEFINCDSPKLPIYHPSIYPLSIKSSLILKNELNKEDHLRKDLNHHHQAMRPSKSQSSIKKLKKRSNFNDEELYSETIIELPTNQISLKNNYLENGLVLNDSLNLVDLLNNTINNKTVTSKTNQIFFDENEKNQLNQEKDAQLKEKQEKILKEIDQINAGHICSKLNKATHFKTKSTKDTITNNKAKDREYWLLVKALEPKFVKMPSLTGQTQPNSEIKNYYRELTEKLELITSILYDNGEQMNAVQHLQLMRKIIREISFLHPHILRARLISLNGHKLSDIKRRHSSFNNHLTSADQFNIDQTNLEDNLVENNNVPIRRSIGGENSDNKLISDSDKPINPNDKIEQWLRAKNIFFYMRDEPIHEFQDVVLTTVREYVSWLDINEVEEKSGTIKEFDQLLSNGHLFVMNEKERLFAGWSGIYFDCAMRRWLTSYTTLIVSCNQCLTKKSSSGSELEMRLLGLLSVDIDLETVDINQCELPEKTVSENTKLEQHQPETNFNVNKLNEFNNQHQNNYEQQNYLNNGQKNYQTDNVNQFLSKANLKSNVQELYRSQNVDGLVVTENRFQINSLDHLMNTKNGQTNDQTVESRLRKNFSNLQFNGSYSSFNRPQPLVSDTSSSSAFTALNIDNHSSTTDSKKYKLASTPSNKFSNRLMLHFGKTNKCHKATSTCQFIPNNGIRKGSGYICKCKPGYYSVLHHFTGFEVERAWEIKIRIKTKLAWKSIDSSPCLSNYNWAFRISLLTISILCICLIFVLTYYIYKHRKIKVFKVASPVFLSICLLGCAIMYSEMIMIFPVLNMTLCILTKITRHMGFCITYSALLLKTWRVSLTYRVKSAHKVKLKDRQLLQWLFPILLIMSIFLGTWIISDPPKEIMILDWNNLKFAICEYNWFDHSLVIGEFLFLLWGIKVCYNVRNAESFFNEAKYITWAIYNIAAVNILMILIHIIILPNAGPDLKYFLGFIRTQLSTTTTILLIFGPKFYRLIKGEGDIWDSRNRARRGINASFSLNGVGVVHEELTDLYQENEELKEQVHKLATQVELMRLRQMAINNRHLKSKHTLGSGGAGSQVVNSSVNSAPMPASLVGLSSAAGSHFHSYSYNQLNPPQVAESAGIGLVAGLVGGVVGGTAVPHALSGVTFSSNAPCQRISPAAELQSEKV